MNTVTASFNTTIRQMTEISQQKKTEHLSSDVDRGLNQGDKT